MPHAILLSNFSKFFDKIVFSLFSLGPLDPLTQHAIALNNFFFKFSSKSSFLSVLLTTCDYL